MNIANVPGWQVRSAVGCSARPPDRWQNHCFRETDVSGCPGGERHQTRLQVKPRR